jgi:hypothetical protein
VSSLAGLENGMTQLNDKKIPLKYYKKGIFDNIVCSFCVIGGQIA